MAALGEKKWKMKVQGKNDKDNDTILQAQKNIVLSNLQNQMRISLDLIEWFNFFKKNHLFF